MGIKWTDDQLLAINTRDKSLLVSAAAGSGKTATLTQRIIESIITDSADISEMLIVTFTRAAVAQLREKIGNAIKDRLLMTPDDENLKKQLLLLPSAKILTIDAFCNDCLKSFPEEAGINPGYRLADAAEVLLLSREVFDSLCNAIFSGELKDKIEKKDFENLCDCLVDSRKMSDIFKPLQTVYNKIRTTCKGIGTLEEFVDAYSPDSFTTPDDTVFGKYITKIEKEEFHYRAKIFDFYAKKLSADPLTDGKYAEIAESEAKLFEEIASLDSFSELRSAVSGITHKNLRGTKGVEKTALMEEFKNVRDKEKSNIKKETAKFFAYSDGEWKEAFLAIYPILRTFLRVIEEFDAALTSKKKQLGMLDYTDIERLAFAALVKNGEPTALAKSIAEQYRYVYIDEYQDVNDLQDSIFRAVSRKNNRFAVGDIKQSIYGFRSANPGIFAKAKREYPQLKEAPTADEVSLFMSNNFRSEKSIIAFVNSVFDKMFFIFKEGIEYKKEDRLEPGDPSASVCLTPKPQICIAPSGETDMSEADTESNFDDEEGNEYQEDDDDETTVAPTVVATKIKELLKNGCLKNGSSVKASDIAIILRSTKNRSELYVQALTELGIGARTLGKKNFFLNSDVLLALCLFNSIDNPLRDVYLTGLLRSPLFKFTPEELLKIKEVTGERGGMGIPFYKKLVRYTEDNPSFEKGKSFIQTLNKWRRLSLGTRTDKFISAIFKETGLLTLASEKGEKENLLRFYEYARSFDSASVNGIGAFIGYINNVTAEKGEFEFDISTAEDDAVTIISSHSSKGLEYPIVFYADTGKQINYKDVNERFIMSVNFGISIRHKTPNGLALVNTPMREAVASHIKEEIFEEELRTLYVSLTRAKEQLYVVGSSKLLTAKEYSDTIRIISQVLDNPAAAKKLKSHLDIISAASGQEPIDAVDFVAGSNIAQAILKDRKAAENSEQAEEESSAKTGEKLDTGAEETQKATPDEQQCAKTDVLVDEELKTLLSKRFSYEYHSKHLTELPEKTAVSDLVRQDESDGTIIKASESNEREFRQGTRTLPEFMAPSTHERSKKKGIATHLFLQFCNFENLEIFGVENELTRLVKNGFLSQEDEKLVRKSEIEDFKNSELFTRILAAQKSGKIWREFRFNTPLPANVYFDDEEKKALYNDKSILVQGVMDCVIEEEDGSLSIIDYKTDRLTSKESEDPQKAEKKFKDAYGSQLYYYALAAEKIFGKKPSKAEIYSLCLGKTIEIDVTKK